MHLEPGTRVGGLMIHEMVGKGAMGEVYRGEQIALRRPVAVKRIAAHLADDADLIARFEREARLVATLQSPHVVAVYDFGRFDDDAGRSHALLVMEWVEGGCNLRHLVASDQALTWPVATALIRDVCRGLATAHEQDVVHRDIKPDNILLAGDGRAKLADFGLAVGADTTAMTQAGTLIGTPDYMPPEACEGERVEAAGDLYSLGATWFHLLTGRPPFVADKLLAVLRAHCDSPAPRVDELAPDVPPQIADLVAACLAKPTEARPRSARALLERIEALTAEGLDLPETCRGLIAEAPSRATMSPTVPTVLAAERGAGHSDSSAATVLSPSNTPDPVASEVSPNSPADPLRRARRHWVLISLLALVLLAVTLAAASALWPDPVRDGLAEVDAALEAGDVGRALTTADHLVATYPDAPDAHAAVREVVEREVADLVAEERFDDALTLLEQRKQERSWLTIDDWDRSVRLAKARHHAERGHGRAAEDVYADVMQRYPTATDIRHAHLADFGAVDDDDTSRMAIYTALRLSELEPGPLPATVGDTLLAGLDWLGTWSKDGERIRGILLERYRDPTLAFARARLDAEDPEERFVGHALLRDAGELARAEAIRFHSWVLFGPGSRFSYQWEESQAWLEEAITGADWQQELEASGFTIPEETPGFLEQWGDRYRAALELMAAGYPERVAAALPRWLDHEDFKVRWNALQLAESMERLELVDLDAFHRRALTDYDRRYRPDSVVAAIEHFAAHADAARTQEALQAGRTYLQDYIDRVTEAGNAEAAENATYLRDLIDETLAERFGAAAGK